MAEYIKQEMSDLDGSGEQRVFYRMKTYHNINAREFVSKLARPGSGLSEGNVLHVLTTLADELAYYMAQGYSVSIDGVGTFKPTLGIAEGKETDTLDGDEQKRNARSIMVNGVNFRASKDLIKETARHCDLKYLDENHFMRVADYMKLTGLRKTSATLELKRLREDPANGITTEGKRNGMIYVKRNNK